MEQNVKKYQFTKYFINIFEERTGIKLTDDRMAYILSVCQTCQPHSKVDNRGRHSEYFTLRIEDQLITVVCDGLTHRIVTAVKETHNEHFKGL